MASSRIIQLRSEQPTCALHEGGNNVLMKVNDIKTNNSFIGLIAKK
jgi:hypothetical protein